MAEKHILSLEVPSVANCEILSIRDTSQYSTLLPVDCSELLITVPGFNSPALIEVTPNFNLNLVSCTLGVQSTDCGITNTPLPDGIYIIKYSVSPNSEVFVEYNHLRVTRLLTTYYEVLCDLEIQACQPDSDKQELLSEMSFIKTLIDAAVANVEYCQSAAQGMQLYNYAKSRLNKIACPSGNCGSSSTYLT